MQIRELRLLEISNDVDLQGNRGEKRFARLYIVVHLNRSVREGRTITTCRGFARQGLRRFVRSYDHRGVGIPLVTVQCQLTRRWRRQTRPNAYGEMIGLRP